LKFTEFKLAYHERALAGVPTPRANAPVVMEPEIEKVAREIAAM
jgi:hypothetical protein